MELAAAVLHGLRREEAAELVGAESVVLLAEQVLAVMQLESVQAVVVLLVEGGGGR